MKISQFPSGGTAQGSDLVPIVRAGGDYTLTVNNLLTTAIYQPGDIRNYGAIQGVDCTAAVTAAAAANSSVVFPNGNWLISSTPTIPTKGILTVLPGAVFTGSGAGALGFANVPGGAIVGEEISDFNPPVTGTLASFEVFRNPHYTGGPAGVSSAIRAAINIGSAVTNSEWAIIGIVNNSMAVSVGTAVGVYGQGNKGSAGIRAGPTWGMVAEGHDKSALADPTDGLIGIEVDCWAAGTDVNGRRVAIDVAVGNIDGGVASITTYGIRIGPTSNNPALGSITNGIYLQGIHSTGINIVTTAGSVVGLNASLANLSGPAIRLAQNQYISFDVADNNRLTFDGTGLGYNSSGTTLVARINKDTGLLNLGVNQPYGTTDSIITQVQLTGAAATNFAHRAQDWLRGTTVSGGLFCNQQILTNITVTNYRGVEIGNPTLQAAALITNCVGIYVGDLTAGGTANIGVQVNITSGAGKLGILSAGTAQNQMNGPLNIIATAVAASVASGVNLGGSTQTTIGANGAASALTANPLGYLIAYVGATKVIFPYYNA